MASDMYTMTPGSAVADTIQQILARRRQEEQQDLINKLTVEEHQSKQQNMLESQRLAREQEARAQAQSEAQIAGSKEDIFQKRLENVRRGTKPEDILDESQRQEMLTRGLFENKGVPQGPTEDGAPMAPIMLFPGSKEEQELARRRDSISSIGDSLPEGSDKSIAIQLAQEGFPHLLQRSFEPMVDEELYNPNTGSMVKTGRKIPQDRPTDVIPWKPQSYAGTAANAPKTYYIYDKNNLKQVIGSMNLSPDEFDAYQVQHPDHILTRSFVPQGGQQNQALIGLRNKVTEAAALLAGSQAKDQGRWFAKGDSPETIAFKQQYTSSAGQLLDALGQQMTPRTRQLVTAIMSDPDLSKMPIAEALDEFELDEGGKPVVLTPDEKMAVEKVMGAVRGIETAQIPFAPILGAPGQ